MDWIVRFLMCMPRGDEARRGVERKRGRDPCCLLCAVKKLKMCLFKIWERREMDGLPLLRDDRVGETFFGLEPNQKEDHYPP